MQASRLKRAFMWVATVGFSLLGLLLLIVGPDAEQRLTGAASIALFGLGGGLFLRLTRRRPPPVARVEVGRTDLLGLSESGLAIPVRAPINLAVVVAFMLVLGGGLIVYGTAIGHWVALAIGFANAGLGLYFGAAHLLRRSTPSRVLLTATGFVLEHPVSSLGVRWADVEGLSLFTLNDAVHVGVDAPREAVVQRTGSRLLLRANRAMSGSAIAVPALGLAADPERLLDALDAYVDDPAPLRDPERELPALRARLDATAVPAALSSDASG